MSTYHSHIIVGNIGNTPQLNETRSGDIVANFDVAINQRNRDGSEQTTWVRVAAWNGLAQLASQYLEKGSLVLVEGRRIAASGWVAQDGTEQATLQLNASDVRFLGGSNGYAKSTIVGHLGADPRSYTTREGKQVANFDVAVNELRSDGSEITTWYRVAAWNGLGAICAEHLAKGRKVLVTGSRLSATAWTDRAGNVRTTIEVTADNVVFLDAPTGVGEPVAQTTPDAPRRMGRRAMNGAGKHAAVKEQMLEAIPF